MPGDYSGVRAEADEDEQAICFEKPAILRHQVVEMKSRHSVFSIPFHLLGDRIPDHFDLRIAEDVLLQNLGRAKLVSPMDEINLASVPRQKIRFFARGVAATNHRDHLLLEECGIAN